MSHGLAGTNPGPPGDWCQRQRYRRRRGRGL